MKKLLRQFQLSLDIDDMMDDTRSNGQSFKEWFKNQFVLPYAYRVPETISFLCKKLEVEDVTQHLSVRKTEAAKVSKKRPRLQMQEDNDMKQSDRVVKISNPAEREE